MMYGNPDIPPNRRELKAHQRQQRQGQRMAETLQQASERLGGQNLQDVYNAFRFATDPEHPEAVNIAVGIAEQFNEEELNSFYWMMRCGRRFGRYAVMKAFEAVHGASDPRIDSSETSTV